MAFYKREVIEHILGITPLDINWYLGLYIFDENPVLDLPNSEVTGARVSIEGAFAWDSTNITNDVEVETGVSQISCDAGGWFLINNTSEDLFWMGEFVDPITMVPGQSLYFPIGTIILDLELP